MEFNILSKRVMSVVVGNGMHWCSYFAFHIGEKLCQPVATTRSGKQRPRPFITFVDSLSIHEVGAPEDLFVVFLFDVILHLEKWITKVVNRTEGQALPAPFLFQIANECRQRAKEGGSIFCAQDFEQHNSYYRQPDGYNCGIFSLINTTAVYAAETQYNQNWLEVRDPGDLFSKVLKPYFDVAKGGKKMTKELAKRAQWFRYNFIRLMATVAPSKHYKVCEDHSTGSYSLHLRLPGAKTGKKVLEKEVDDMLTEVALKGSGKKKEEAAAKTAAEAKVRAAAEAKAKATAEAEAKKKKATATVTPTQGTDAEADAESPSSKKLRIKKPNFKKVLQNVKGLCILNILKEQKRSWNMMTEWTKCY